MGRLLRKKNPAKKKKRQGGAAIKTDDGAVKNVSQGSDQGTAEGTVIKLSQKKFPGPGRKKNHSSATLAKSGIGGFVDKCIQFLREVKAELKKVTWPPRKNTIGSTFVVIILVIIISVFLGLVDAGLSNLIRLVVQ
ncbi:MAG: preprotein translocase subunit SecE [Desulfobacterales bacterium]|nr:preprotein translocase subunit SecE [Desulfobacterales bacterium]